MSSPFCDAMDLARRVLETTGHESNPIPVAVAVITGTYCPVTLGHLAVLREAQLMLMGEASLRPAESVKAARPRDLHVYEAVLGFVRVNADPYVQNKMFEKGCSEAFIPRKTRVNLIEASLAELGIDWAGCVESFTHASRAIMEAYPLHRFDFFWVDGADHAVTDVGWRTVTAKMRRLCAGRPSTPGEFNGTDDVIAAMVRDGQGPDSEWYQEGLYTLLPEQEDISSTSVRKAQQVPMDMDLLRAHLPGCVLKWCIWRGPYRNPAMQGDLPEELQMGRLTDVVDNSGLCAPLGIFIVRRGVKPWLSQLHEEPLFQRSRSSVVIEGEANCVEDGARVHLCRVDDERRFGLVLTERSEGWVQLKYLFPTEGKTIARYERRDGGPDTVLRAEPSDAHDFVTDGARTIPLTKGQEVQVLWPDRAGDAWTFLFVLLPGDGNHCGWVKLQYLHFE